MTGALMAGATSPLHIVLIALLGLFLKLETASLVIRHYLLSLFFTPRLRVDPRNL